MLPADGSVTAAAARAFSRPRLQHFLDQLADRNGCANAQRLERVEAGSPTLPDELDPRVLLAAVRSDLAEHFSAEESPTYFGIVMSEAPALTPQVAGLKWEQLTMLRTSNALCALANDRESWRHMPGPTRELIGQLECHERSESALLRGLFRNDS